MHPKDADGIANSVDPDQTAPHPWSDWSEESALFAQIYLSENLRYHQDIVNKQQNMNYKWQWKYKFIFR